MKGYLSTYEACSEAGITLYALNNLIEDGKVRVKETSDIANGRKARQRFVCYQDILDAKIGLELSFIDISKVASVYGLTASAVRQQIKKRRLRWRRQGVHLQPCVSDLDLYISETATQKSGQQNSTLPRSA